MFDARLYRASLELPTYLDVDDAGNEVKFEGEIVPFNVVSDVLDQLKNVSSLPMEQVDQLIADTVALIKMPVEVLPYIMRLPLEGRLEALISFFTSLHGVKKSIPV